jgi:hypothetical protein
MKKLLTILLFLPLISFGQITVAAWGPNSFTTSGIATISGATFTAGKLYIIFLCTTDASTPGTSTITSSNTTWTEIATVTGAIIASPTIRLTAFRFLPTSTVSETLNVTTGGTQTGAWAYGLEITGMDNTGTNGANAIVQSVTANDNATIHPSISLAAISSTRNAVIAGFANDVNPPAGTVEASWTEHVDNGFNTPTTGGYVMSRISTTDNTPSWSAAVFSNWLGIAIEIKASSTGFPLYFFTKSKHEKNSNTSRFTGIVK